MKTGHLLGASTKVKLYTDCEDSECKMMGLNGMGLVFWNAALHNNWNLKHSRPRGLPSPATPAIAADCQLYANEMNN